MLKTMMAVIQYLLKISLSKEAQYEAFKHAMKHILRKDFGKMDVNKIEVNTHSA